jgi:formylglycine-generating enzyme required for sulfatase activity
MLSQIKPMIEELASAQLFVQYRKRYIPEMVVIRGDTMSIGDGRSHQVKVSDFRMGKHEVTVAQYFLFCEAVNKEVPEKPSWGWQQQDAIMRVSWYDAVVYCNYISELEGIAPAYNIDKTVKDTLNTSDYDDIKWVVALNEKSRGYRLPIEAEWEFAARGGREDRGKYRYSGSDTLKAVGWYSDNSGSTVHPVGKLKPNGLGLYDMSGNLWEWCWDWYGDFPNGAKGGSSRVVRGGSWLINARFAEVSYRSDYRPTYWSHYIGFRLAVSAVGVSAP